MFCVKNCQNYDQKKSNGCGLNCFLKKKPTYKKTCLSGFFTKLYWLAKLLLLDKHSTQNWYAPIRPSQSFHVKGPNFGFRKDENQIRKRHGIAKYIKPNLCLIHYQNIRTVSILIFLWQKFEYIMLKDSLYSTLPWLFLYLLFCSKLNRRNHLTFTICWISDLIWIIEHINSKVTAKATEKCNIQTSFL